MSKFIVDWIYKLEEDFVYDTKKVIGKNYVFRDKKGKIRMTISEDGIITIKKSYTWNGCTPKFCIFDIYFGTPEGAFHKSTVKPKTYQATLVHDSMYQFMGEGFPYTRKEVDNLFLEIMSEYNFAPRYVYYFFVRLLGGSIGIFSNWWRTNKGVMEVVKSIT